MDSSNLLRARRSRRHFSDEAVPRQVIEELLDEACWAPSAGNRQPWRVAALAPNAARHLIDQNEQQVWELFYGQVRSMLAEREPDTNREKLCKRTVELVKNEILLRGRPWLLLVYHDAHLVSRLSKELRSTGGMLRYRVQTRRGLWSKLRLLLFVLASWRRALRLGRLVDYASVSNFIFALTLAAEERGLASCIQYSWALVPNRLHRVLEIPGSAEIVGAVAIGYAAHSGSNRIGALAASRDPVQAVWYGVGEDGGLARIPATEIS